MLNDVDIFILNGVLYGVILFYVFVFLMLGLYKVFEKLILMSIESYFLID